MENKRKLAIIFSSIIVLIILISVIVTMLLRNNLSPEETVSKFMYLVETKEYEKAKKLAKGNIDKLDVVSNINPSKLTFNFSEDKKEAETILATDKDMATETKMIVSLDNTILGWKIKDYEVVTDFIDPQTIQEKLENGEEVSDGEFIHWAISESTDPQNIPIYASDNSKILILFAHFMSNGEYEKAEKLRKPINVNSEVMNELTEEEIKEFNWSNYNIIDSLDTFGMTTFIINDINKKISVFINIDHTIASISEMIY